MKFQKQFKSSRKNNSFSVVDVILQVNHECDKRGVYVSLYRKFRVAYNDDDLLTSFIKSIESDPIKYYKHHFIYNAPIKSTVSINPVNPSAYTIDSIITDEGLFVVSQNTRLDIYDQLRYNRSILRYELNL